MPKVKKWKAKAIKAKNQPVKKGKDEVENKGSTNDQKEKVESEAKDRVEGEQSIFQRLKAKLGFSKTGAAEWVTFEFCCPVFTKRNSKIF